MALKNLSPDSPDPGPDKPERGRDAKDEEPDSVLLELALFTNYRMGHINYEKGEGYRFLRSDAMKLLQETDLGRPIWRLYRKSAPKRVVKDQIRDATGVKIPEAEEPIHGLPVEPPKRIDIGDDSEIADVLGRSDEPGNITV